MKNKFLPAAPVKTHIVAGTEYVGANPIYTQVTDPDTGLVQTVKVARGVPFRRVSVK